MIGIKGKVRDNGRVVLHSLQWKVKVMWGVERMLKRVLILSVILGVVGFVVFSYTNRRDDLGIAAAYPKTYREYKSNPSWRGGERGAIVPALYFTGMARRAYESAAAIPEVLDHLFCYCYCTEHHGHRSLRTCFTDGHGSGCDICMGEAIRAKELYDKGYSIKEIRAKIDREFYQPYN